MEIKKEIGCYNATLTVDGKFFYDLSEEKKKTIALRIVHWLASQDELGWFISATAEQFGICTSDDEPCECCGHWGETYELNI